MIKVYNENVLNSSKDSTEYEIVNEIHEPAICMLTDIISAKVTRTINSPDILEFEYLPNGENSAEIQLRRIVECKSDPYRETQYFRIYSIDKDINGTISVYAKHIVCDLADCYTTAWGYDYAGSSTELLAKRVNSYISEEVSSAYVFPSSDPSSDLLYQRKYSNGYFKYNIDSEFSIPSDLSDIYSSNVISIDNCIYGDDEGSVLSVIGGEMEFDRYEIIHKKSIGKKTNYKIEYGFNMTDFSWSSDISRSYSDILPYWTGNVEIGTTKYDGYKRFLTMADDGKYDEISYLGYKFSLRPFDDSDSGKILSANLIPILHTDDDGKTVRNNFTRILPVDITNIYNYFYDLTGDETLGYFPSREDIALCGIYYIVVNSIGKQSISMDIDFVDLANSPEFKEHSELLSLHLGDILQISNKNAGISGEAECTSTVYNVLTDRYDSVSLGDIEVTFAEIIVTDQDKKTKKKVFYKKSTRTE